MITLYLQPAKIKKWIQRISHCSGSPVYSKSTQPQEGGHLEKSGMAKNSTLVAGMSSASIQLSDNQLIYTPYWSRWPEP